MEETRAQLFSAWIGTGKRILDLGCRDGTLTRYYMSGNDVLGSDIDASALQYARDNYGFAIQQLDLNGNLPFEKESFDIIVMAEVLEHLPYPTITLQEVHRILKTHGLFIGSIPLAYYLKDRYRVLRGKKLTAAGEPTHLQFFTYEDILSLLTQYFDVEEIRALQGSKRAQFSIKLFARSITFRCIKSE